MSISRREFIRLATLMGGVSLFAGCTLFKQPETVPPYIQGAPGVDPVETLPGVDSVYTVCGMCTGNCGICCRVAQGSLVKIGGNPYNPIAAVNPLPFNTPVEKANVAGASVCAVGGSGLQTLYDPFRVAKPLKRVGPRGSGKWKALTWDTAFREIVHGGNLFGEGNIKGLKHIKSLGDSFTFQVGRAEWGSLTFIKKFLTGFPRSILAEDRSARLSQTARLAAEMVFGPGVGPVEADYGSARAVISFGDAPLDSGVPLVSLARKITDSRIERSLKWAVVDPRLSTSASKSDLWVPVAPETDIDLALGILKTLVDDHPDAVRIPREEAVRLLSGRTIAQCAQSCGLSPEYFRRLARMLVEAGSRSAVIPGRGILAQQNGLDAAAIVLTLNRAVGSVPGTGGLVSCSDSFLGDAEKRLLGDSQSSWTMENAGKPAAALMVWAADPVYERPSVADKLKDSSGTHLFIAVSTQITETADLADYILPDTTYLERWDICRSPASVATPGVGVRVPVVGAVESKTGRYFPILPETMVMEDILVRLAAGLKIPGFGEQSPGGMKNAWAYHQQALRASLTAMKSAGLPVEATTQYVSRVIQRGGIFFEAGKQAVATRPADTTKKLPSTRSLRTPSTAPGSKDEFTLITYTLPFHRSPEAGLNSWLLEVLPENRILIGFPDARSLGIRQGQLVEVETLDGAVRVRCRAMIAPGIRQGVVAFARGFGYRGSGAVSQQIDGVATSPDKPRAAGVNPELLMAGSAPHRVRVKAV